MLQYGFYIGREYFEINSSDQFPRMPDRTELCEVWSCFGGPRSDVLFGPSSFENNTTEVREFFSQPLC